MAGLLTVSPAAAMAQELEVSPETSRVVEGVGAPILTAVVDPPLAATAMPMQVAFEIESGPNDKDGNTPGSRDLSCTVLPGTEHCRVAYDGTGTTGADRIRAWIDDGNPFSLESDRAEGRYAGLTDCLTTGSWIDPPSACVGEAQPGNAAERDGTDLVEVAWGPAPDPGNGDRDGDGVPDAEDNCSDVANPDQADGDDDAIGDACDPDPDLRVQVSDSPDPVRRSEAVTYSIVVDNATRSPATDAFLDAALPEHAGHAEVKASQGSCAAAGTTVSCALGEIRPGEEVVVAVALKPLRRGTATLQTSVSSPSGDRDPADNTDTETTTVAP